MSEKENNAEKQIIGAVTGGVIVGGAGWALGSVGVAGLVGIGTAFSLPLLLPGLIVGGLVGALVASNTDDKNTKEK